MTDWFVSGHPGAVEWARRQGIAATMVPHFDVAVVQPGDRVFGTLHVPVAPAVFAADGEYWPLTLDRPAAARRRELSADDMDGFGARLERFTVVPFCGGLDD